MTIYTWQHQRPNLTIEPAGGANLGRCYNAHSLRVTSNRPLKNEDLKALREAGWLGYGQEFRAYEQEPIVDTYHPDGKNYFGEPNVPQTRKFYVYLVTNYVDSSD